VLHTRANRAGLAAVAAAAEAAGAATLSLTGDLADPATPDALVAACLARFGRLDRLVANAGYADRTPATALEPAALARAQQVILGGFHRLVRAALPALARAEGAGIVAVSAFGAHAIGGDWPRFPATAAVVPGFIAKEPGTAAALSPAAAAAGAGAVPLRRAGRPEEVAAVIAFLLEARLSGQCLPVDGGLLAAHAVSAFPAGLGL
jgi:3-oxoacyl-[acyl-carrier protein] reductase